MTTRETLRACIERGGRGEFAKALLAFYADLTVEARDRVTRVAVDEPYETLRELHDALQGAHTEAALHRGAFRFDGERIIREHVRRHFPFLAHLDAPADEWPDLRGDTDGE